MLKTIAEVSPELVDFIEALDLSLSHPQKRHVAQVADGPITTEGSKTLSALYCGIVGDPCPKATVPRQASASEPPAKVQAPAVASKRRAEPNPKPQPPRWRLGPASSCTTILMGGIPVILPL